MNMIKLKCLQCQNEFDKNEQEYNLAIQRGKDQFFCSRECFRLNAKTNSANSTFVKIKCEWCDEEFERSKKEIDRNAKNGRQNFCSISCATKDRNSKDPRQQRQYVSVICGWCKQPFQRRLKAYNADIQRKKNLFCCAEHAHNHLNETLLTEDSPFLFLLTKIKHRCEHKKKGRKLTCTLTMEDLKTQWKKQNGLCPYTQLPMVLPYNGNGWKHYKEVSPAAASVDRIDSGKDYTPDNIEIVCRFINFGKSEFSKEVIQKFISDVKSADANCAKETTPVCDGGVSEIALETQIIP